jgi:rhodanese-related sulfurtransferase
MKFDAEIRHLVEIMPASGRMLVKVVSKPQQSQVIDTPFPMPWQRDSRPIYINFDLWRELTRAQRDLLFLRMVAWSTKVRWFKPDLYQGVAVAGLLGGISEFAQGDAVGVVVAGGLSAIALNRIWRNARSSKGEIEADEAAIKVACRRGYDEAEAAQALLESIEAVAKIEGRMSLNFTELLRSQNLRVKANLSPVAVPETVKQYE